MSLLQLSSRISPFAMQSKSWAIFMTYNSYTNITNFPGYTHEATMVIKIIFSSSNLIMIHHNIMKGLWHPIIKIIHLIARRLDKGCIFIFSIWHCWVFDKSKHQDDFWSSSESCLWKRYSVMPSKIQRYMMERISRKPLLENLTRFNSSLPHMLCCWMQHPRPITTQ